MNQEHMTKQESEREQAPEQSHDEAELPVPPLLGAPRTPLPDLITDERALDAAIAELRAGEGDIALDAERASGYRYSQRAYLIQIYRRGGGLHLIDPAAFPENEIPQIFSPLNLLIPRIYHVYVRSEFFLRNYLIPNWQHELQDFHEWVWVH
jgi:hypothetical protein